MCPAIALETRWTKTLSDYARHTLLVSGNRLVFREGHDRLSSLLPSGRVAWQRELRGGRHVHGTLRHIGESVYVDEQPVLRIDIKTGHVLAERDFGPWPYLCVESGFLTCYSGTEDTYWVLDPESLDPIWTFADPDGRFSLHDGLICVSNADGSGCLIDPETTDVIGTVPPPLGGASHVHFGDSVCLFSDGRRIAYDFGAGRITWCHDESPSIRSVALGPASSITVASIGYHDWPRAYGSVAYCQGRALSAYDLATGERLWRQFDPVGVTRRSEPREGRMAVVTDDSRVHIIDTHTGESVGTSEPLKREINAVRLASGGCVAVESFTYDRNASQIHFLQPPVAAKEEGER